MRRIRLCLVFPTLAFVLVSSAMPASAGLPILIVEYQLPEETSPPHNIAAGPDGNIWFTHANAVGRITPTGVITEFPTPSGFGGLEGITTWPDGNLWFAERVANKIGKMLVL